MEQETFFSGYCRNIDGSRMVCAVKENGELSEADCDYPACPFIQECTVAQGIAAFLQNNL